MKKTLVAFVLLLTVICTINSCKKEDDGNNNITANTLLGTWKRPYQTYTVGITFTSDGNFSFGVYSGTTYAETITGKWSTNGSGKVTFTNQSGSMEACPNTPCVYDFTATATQLVTVVNDDPCAGRADKVQGAWSK